MIDAISHLDHKIAAGVLARAAVALGDPFNPSAAVVVDDEAVLRQRIVSVAREKIGISPSDDSPEAIEKIGDFLDQEADGLIGPPDIDAALRRLAEGGNLPPDLYEIRVDPAIGQRMGERRYPLELSLIKATIGHSDRQQHFARSQNPREPSLVSLFFRSFRTRWPFRDFGMLVVASRDGLLLYVGQAWRIYPPLVDVSAAKNLVDMLRIFTTRYGAKVTRDGRVGSFFLTVDGPVPPKTHFTIDGGHKGKKSIAISSIVQHQEGRATAALVTAVDLNKYDDDLVKMAVAADQIEDNLVDHPLPRTS